MTRSIRAHWYDTWDKTLDEALEGLPEAANCPRDLYRRMIQSRMGSDQQAVLVTRGDTALGVVGLRRQGEGWEPITNWLIPGYLCAARREDLLDVLRAVGEPLHVGWWRQPSPPPECLEVRSALREVTYEATLDEALEAYWKKKTRQSIARARRRCEGFAAQVNEPGMAPWVIRQWARHYCGKDEATMPELKTRILAAEYLERIGQHYTVTIRDGERVVAGNTEVRHGDTIVAQSFYRDPDYENHGIGMRLVDATFEAMRRLGFGRIDIGGSHDYKRNLAPEGGEKFTFEFISPRRRYGRKLRQLARQLAARLPSLGAR